MTPVEHSVTTGDLRLAVKTWGDPKHPAIIALHGWLDNAATFDRLAPLFPGYFWVVPDLPGHGRSEHRGKGAEYSIWNYAVEVIALADAMDLPAFILVGHSMGGGISSLLAGLFPERVRALVLLDVIGTITTPAANSPAQLRLGIEQRVGKPLRRAGLYSTREAAILARVKKGITRDAASLLGERGITESPQGFYWCHDQHLALKSLMSLDGDQMAAFLRAITCPVLLVMSAQAVQGEAEIRERSTLVQDIRVAHLDGGHHQHLDGDVAAIAELIGGFLG